MSDANKLMKLQLHETGQDCKCRNKCFDKVSDDERKQVIKRMSCFKSHDEINIYLSGLISICQVERRRPRKDEKVAVFRDVTNRFIVRVKKNDEVLDITVCKKGFLSIHGIGVGKLNHLLQKLKANPDPPRDGRGQHDNRPHKTDTETLNKLHNHINSSQSRNSHYSLKKSNKVYLSEELNINKMHEMFLQKHPEEVTNVSYETYRTVLNRDFNISFGYPRSDTCSYCDAFVAKQKCLSRNS